MRAVESIADLHALPYASNPGWSINANKRKILRGMDAICQLSKGIFTFHMFAGLYDYMWKTLSTSEE